MRTRVLMAAFVAAFVTASTFAAGQRISQPLRPMNAAELQIAIRKLGVVGSALYVAAHPDDENTALLAYLSRERRLRTGYLSLTRGEGGQNLIGPEKGALLGVIRTQELLAARDVDGAEQFFTRAVDFGYSKSPEETLSIWGKEAILSDVVRAIRAFQPDVIITRFPSNGAGGHGQHTASALLAEEAFVVAADPARFPEQLGELRPWQAKRIIWNAWLPRGPAANEPPPKLSVDLGTYNPLLGRSYAEIAAESRTYHKSQGFGAAERRGTLLNYFQNVAGTPAERDILEGIDLSWSRVPGSAQLSARIAEAARTYDPEDPAGSVPALVRVWAAMRDLPDSPIVVAKRNEALDAIRSAAGLWIEAVTPAPEAVPGSEVKVAATVVNRSMVPVSVASIELRNGEIESIAAFGEPTRLEPNLPFKADLAARLPRTMRYSNPQWLAQSPEPSTIPRPDTLASLTARVTLNVASESIPFDVPVVYRVTDPVHGERYRALSVTPPVTGQLDHDVYLFPSRDAKALRVRVRSHRPEALRANVRLALPAGFSARPDVVTIELPGASAEATASFEVTPSEAIGSGTIEARVETDGATYNLSRATVDYTHIPHQQVFPGASARAVRLDLRKEGSAVGYVEGSGDDIPEILEQLGYRVTKLSDDDIDRGNLAEYDAIIVGVRAYNTRPQLRNLQSKLLEYVEKGGTLVVQYNTLDESLPTNLGPYPFRVSRDRVTDEASAVTIVNPEHRLLRQPNRITAADFQGWVQERGLYFPNAWDSHYETLIAANDSGESAMDGGLLVTNYGKGRYVYTGYSWFRQLPAGVPGAIRLFVNLISAE
ncbi:MAG: PIG-L family deacetylase [Thermoanaerobaculia bacterium]